MNRTAIHMPSLGRALLIGAAAGALFGMLSSQPLSASAPPLEARAEPSTCRLLCESVVWLRAPLRHRSTGLNH